MKYDDLDIESKKLLGEYKVSWNPIKNIYMTGLHKDFYLNERELKSKNDLEEFCKLIQYLNDHLEYGVNADWAASNLNGYVYLRNKENLSKQFPHVINALSRFYKDSDIIKFYESQSGRPISPTIIDLIGTTGAGKTTFCQQFVDTESKQILKLTISESAESTVIQTDILILDTTCKKMFLKARNKTDIMKDIIAVALEMDLNGEYDSVKESIKKITELIDRDTIDKVSNFFATDELLEKFEDFAEKVQDKYKAEAEEKFLWLQEHAADEELVLILDERIEELSGIVEHFDKTYFYGYRQEYDLEVDAETKLITTIANKVFNDRKEDPEEYPEIVDMVSYRLLFEHAILVLPCSQEAKDNLDYDFQQGMVFRDSQGHRLDEQFGLASDFEVKNKIFLIPVDNGGYLIDDRYSNLFEKILISEPEHSIFVLTKIDNIGIYKNYKKSSYEDDKAFKREMTKKIANTHNALLSKFLAKQNSDSQNTSEYYIDEARLFENFMASFDNAYFSEIDDSTYASDAHKIYYSGNALEDLDKEKLYIRYLNSWFDIVASVIDENQLTYRSNLSRIAKADVYEQIMTIDSCCNYIMNLINFYISKQDWSRELDEQLELFNEDFRSIYQKGAVWYFSNYKTDGNTTTNKSYFKDLTAKIIREINSYITKDSGQNYMKNVIHEHLGDYLMEIYSSNRGDNSKVLNAIAGKIISNSVERAVKISYKVYDRKLRDYNFLDNLKPLFAEGDNGVYVMSSLDFEDIRRMKRPYGTYTEFYAGIYCHLMAKFKYNLETYFRDSFRTVLENELYELDKAIE